MTATRKVRFEWAVRYRRRDWVSRQVRVFQSESPARRLVRKLCREGRPDLAPIVELVVERRPVGAWEPDEEMW